LTVRPHTEKLVALLPLKAAAQEAAALTTLGRRKEQRASVL
jgi:hypothetical protein